MNAAAVRFHPEAVAEGAAAAARYRQRSERVATAFLLEFEAAVARIVDRPEAWPPYLHGTRRLLLRRFPFFLVYRQDAAALDVISVVHAKRKPGYWRER